MSKSVIDVAYVAELARLELTDDEKKTIHYQKKNSQKSFLKAIKSFLKKSTNVSMSFLKPLSLMNIMYMSMHQRKTQVP